MFERAYVFAGERSFVCASACVRGLEYDFACAIARGFVHIFAFSCVGVCVCW